MIEKFPELNSFLNHTINNINNTRVKTAFKMGYEYFAKKGSIQKYDNLKNNSIYKFGQAMLGMFTLDKEALNQMNQIFQRIVIGPTDKWISSHILMSSNTTNMTSSYMILSRKSNFTFDFVLSKINIAFSIANNLTIVTQKYSIDEESILLKQVSSDAERNAVEIMKTFCEMASFRNVKNTIDGEKINPNKTYAVPVMAIMAGISAGLDIYKKAAEAFKTTIKSETIKEITDRGFEAFMSDTEVHVMDRLLPEGMPFFQENFMDIYDIPEEHQKKLKNIVKLMPLVGAYTWDKADMLYNVDEGGNCGWITLMYSKNADDNSYNVLVTHNKSAFKLAPDILVIETSRSFLGGIYEDVSQTERKVPRNLVEGDIEKLQFFFKVMVFKKLAMLNGMTNTIPNKLT